MKDFHRAALFADEMAIAGQTIDDLEDMTKDIERGRLNYAASYLIRQGKNEKRRHKQPLAQVVQILLTTDASMKLFSELRQHIDVAEEFIRPLRLLKARDYLDSYRRSLDKMEDHLHRQRVRLLFGNHIAPHRR
jgi:hypothetical protein